MLVCARLLLALGIFPTFGWSESPANATVAREFDLPHGNFRTLPPEGPPATTNNGDTDGRDIFTSPLMPPVENRKIASTSGSRFPHGRPGIRLGSDEGRGVMGNPRSAQSRPYTPHKVCQYVFTVEDGAECTHTSTEIAVHHVSRTVLPSKDDFGELSHRLQRLETEIFGASESTPRQELQRDGHGIVEVTIHDEEHTPANNPNKTEDRPSDDVPQSLIEMAKGLITQVLALEKAIEKSEKEKQDLRTQNKILISSLRRSAAGRRNFIALRTSLENSLRELREENSRLTSTNKTISQQNMALRSQRHRMQSLVESHRTKIRNLEMEHTNTMESATNCERQQSECSIVQGRLEIHVRNLTSELDRYRKISYEDESLQYELEKAREKNEALTVENDNLKEKLENATTSIERLSEEIRNARQETTTFSIAPSSRRDDQDYSYCGKITSISAPETIREPQSYLEKYGVWMMDPLEELGEGKVWYMNTFRDKVKELKQYESLRKFVLNQPETVITLPVFVENNGGVMYNGSFYYQRRNSRKIVRPTVHLVCLRARISPAGIQPNFEMTISSLADIGKYSYDLRLKRILKERAIHRAGFHATFAYQWGGLTDIDLSVDEFGLWVIFSTRQNNGNIVLSRLNPVTLRAIYTAKTAIPKRTVANAFMACGVLYTLDSYDSANASLNYEFDTFRRRSKRISIPFANRHRLNVMVDYNPHTREIFSWDHSYQVKYYVNLDKSLGKTAHLSPRGGGRRRRRAKRSSV